MLNLIEHQLSILIPQKEFAIRSESWFQKYPVQETIDLIHQYPRAAGYDYVAASAKASALQLSQDHGNLACYQFHSLLILVLMKQNLSTLESMNLTQQIRNCSVQNWMRIIDLIEADDIMFMSYDQDRFHKILSAASLRFICTGALKLNVVNFPKGLIKRHPLKCLKLAGICGPTTCFYEMHLDSDDEDSLKMFHEQGWIEFYRRCAEQLILEPEIGGIIGTSWFFDPDLVTTSPRLGYLYTQIINNGGLGFKQKCGPRDVANATKTSKTRRELYLSGQYIPQKYKMIWPRNALISFAEAHRPT